MTLGFAAPLALGLAALVALPIIAHLTQQKPKTEVRFGAMMLLQQVVKRLRRRARLQDLLVFVLRTVALLALVGAAAGAVLRWQDDVPELGGSGRVVVVIDQSMSMAQQHQGGSLLSRARADAAARVRDLPAGTLVGLVSYDDAAHVRTPELTSGPARVLELLDTLEPTMGGSNLRGALLEARRLLAGEPGEVLLFSDEAGPVQVPGAQDELARLIELGSAVVPLPVRPEAPRNVAVTQAAYGDGLEGGQVTFRLTNYGPDAREVPCEVVLPDGAAIPVFVDAPPSGPAEARVTVPREASGGVGEVRCTDSDLPLDDTRYFHLPRVGASRVLIVDGDPGDTPINSEVYFLERALAPWGGSRSGVRPDVVTPGGLALLDPTVHSVVLLANVSDPRPFGPALTQFVAQGGAVVIGVGDNVTADRYNQALGPLLPSAFRRPASLAERAEAPVPLQLPNTATEPFTPFARGGRSGFARVGAWRVMTLEPFAESDTVRTLLRYEGGAPALVSHRVGKGQVLLWTSSFDRGWTNLPLQAVFVPLTQRIVGWLGGEADTTSSRLMGTTGVPVTVDHEDLAPTSEVRGPDGALVSSRWEGSALVFTPSRPGAYEVAVPDGPRAAWVAVNVDPAESDVRAGPSVARVEAEMSPELFQAERDLSPGLLAGALLMLLASAGVAATPRRSAA